MELMENPDNMYNMIGESIYKMIKGAAKREGQPAYLTVKADVIQTSINGNSHRHSVAIQTHRKADNQVVAIESPALMIANIDDPQAKSLLKIARTMGGNLDNKIEQFTESLKATALKDGQYILIQKGKGRALFSIISEQNQVLESQKTFIEICQIIQTSY